MWIIKILVFNLFLVFITELPLAYILGARTKRTFFTVALANIITNPTVVIIYLYITLFHVKWLFISLVPLEAFAFFTEGFLFLKYKIFKNKNPYLISLLLNFTSYVVGEFIELFM